jgi:YD repeat-containing protein
VRDANQHTTAYEYDKLNRVTRRTLPLNMSEAFTYDSVGNLLQKRDFNLRRTNYAYDALNRLTGKTPEATLGEPAVFFTYTPTGARAAMVDASGTTAYTGFRASPTTASTRARRPTATTPRIT